ncbi:MAG: hypothetical protein WC246_01890 [Candidatus Paceibacterota bacterium]|jgi:hypothetical protein
MFKNGRVLTPEQFSELFGDIIKMITKALFGFTKEEVQWLIGHKKQLAETITGAITSLVSEIDTWGGWRNEWEKFYSDVMEMTVDFSSLVIPEKPEGNWWLVVVAPDVTHNQIIEKLRTLFPVWINAADFDEVIDITKEQRRATDNPYAIWVKANDEAGRENAHKSANDLGTTPQITLIERLILEYVHFKWLGGHLDISTTTLCAGSRKSDGNVPRVHWDGGHDRLDVYWYRADDRSDYLRSRSVSC